jgi:cytochrome P450
VAKSGSRATGQSLAPGATRPVPGPRGVPGLGVIPFLAPNPFGYLMHAASLYAGIFRFPVGPVEVYLVSHPDYVQHILVTNAENYNKGPIMNGIRMALGNGLFTSDGEFWRRQRRLMQPAFHNRMIQRMTGPMSQAIEEHLARLQPAVDEGRAIDLLKEMVVLNIKITLDTLFGATVSPADAVAMLYETDRVFLGMSKNLWTFFVPGWLPVPGRRAYVEAIQRLDRRVKNIIAERRASGVARDDLLGILLAMRDEESGEGMTDSQVRDEIFTMFLAGYESTSSALTWTLYLLGRHPAVEGKLQQELATVLNGRTPTYEDLPRLPYARMILDEALRLYPPFPMFFRTAVNHDVIDGYPIPGGASIVISPYAGHHHPLFWASPETFDPERFCPERFTDDVKNAYFPFGKGQRLCIGRPVALTQAHLTLCILAQRYARTPLGAASGAMKWALTLQPRDGLPMRLERRLP